MNVGVWVATYNIDYINIQRHYEQNKVALCPSEQTDQLILHCPNPEAMYTIHDSCLSQKRTGCDYKVLID